MPVMVFIVAQLLLGCGGSPLLTLGTTYVDDHVRPESSSMYIGKLSLFLYNDILNKAVQPEVNSWTINHTTW